MFREFLASQIRLWTGQFGPPLSKGCRSPAAPGCGDSRAAPMPTFPALGVRKKNSAPRSGRQTVKLLNPEPKNWPNPVNQTVKSSVFWTTRGELSLASLPPGMQWHSAHMCVCATSSGLAVTSHPIATLGLSPHKSTEMPEILSAAFLRFPPKALQLSPMTPSSMALRIGACESGCLPPGPIRSSHPVRAVDGQVLAVRVKKPGKQ